jgi:hypothetical protein
MKSTDETNYLEAQIDTMAFHDCIAGLGQEPDQATQEIGGSQAWRDNTNAPFPGQATYVTAITSINASIACNTLSTTTQTVRLVGQTILPIFDNSISMWDDVVAASVAIGDLFITATDAQLKGATNSCTDCTAILPASTSSVTYYQPQLMSSDYYCVGSDGDPLVPKIFIAWNIGTTYF